MSLIQRTFSTFEEILAFEACVYNFLILDCAKVFFFMILAYLITGREGREGTLGEDVVRRGTTEGGALGFSAAPLEIGNDLLDSLVFLLETNIPSRNFMMLVLPFLV